MKVTMRNDLVPLALVSSRLATLTGEAPPGYARTLRAALDGLLPAVRVGGRWFVAEADLGAAAAVFGMRSAPASAAPPRKPGQPTRLMPDGSEGAPAASRGAPNTRQKRIPATRIQAVGRAAPACSTGPRCA